MARVNTRAFIAADPRDVALHRPVKTADGAGGYIEGDSQLPSQRVRIIPLSGLVWDRSDTDPDTGRTADVTMQLVGDADLDIRKGDWFPFSENDLPGRYEVVHVSPTRHYRTSANLRFKEDHRELGG
jgi:hypothetical protein